MRTAFTFPEVGVESAQRPSACGRCGQVGMWRHQRTRRPVVDPKVTQVQVIQYQCGGCGASLTICPPGLAPGRRHTTRTKTISVVMWGLGLSLENTSALMKGLEMPVSKTGVLLNVREMGAKAMAKQKRARGRLKAPVLGADETQVKLSGQGVTVGFLTDPESGQIVGMEILASREGEELARWIIAAAEHFGAKALVSDDLESYKPAAEKAGLQHQICLAHWRKATTLRLKRIEGYEEEKALIKEALRQLDRPALRAIRWLHRQFAKAPPPRKGERQSPAYALRMLTLDLLENWNRLTCHQETVEPLLDNLGRKVARSYTIPTTNNATENAIGRGGKIRAKRMRGFKRADTILPILMLLASLGGVLAGVPFQSLVA